MAQTLDIQPAPTPARAGNAAVWQLSPSIDERSASRLALSATVVVAAAASAWVVLRATPREPAPELERDGTALRVDIPPSRRVMAQHVAPYEPMAGQLYASSADELVPFSPRVEAPRGAPSEPMTRLSAPPLAFSAYPSSPRTAPREASVSATYPPAPTLARPMLRALPSLSGFPTLGSESSTAGRAFSRGVLAAEQCPGCPTAVAPMPPATATGIGTPIPPGMLFLSGNCDGTLVYGIRNIQEDAIHVSLTSDGAEAWSLTGLRPGEVGYIKASKPIRAMNAGIVRAL